ncbi:hypothetical protein ACIBK9_28660 [Nonomuraea sp. NPDC050227]|uniref:hypothetical protein n=1 Tax=Nonomuraea sp. NPDC050227 TaxID=3364360 RepID=UPI0037A26B6A
MLITGQGVQIVGWMTASVDGVPSRVRNLFLRDHNDQPLRGTSTEATTESDIHSAGTILLASATGQWTGDFSAKTLRCAWERSGMDRSLGRVLLNCLGADLADRPTAAELVETFTALNDDLSMASTTEPAAPRTYAAEGSVQLHDRSRPAYRDTFTLLNRVTNCHIFEGDGTRPIREENVRVLHHAGRVEQPAIVRKWRREIEEEETRKAAAGQPHRWNSPRFAIEGVTVGRGQTGDEPVITLRLSDADYYDFLAVSTNLDRPLPEGSGTLRTVYLENSDPVAVPPFLSCSIGAMVAVETGIDGKLLFARRSSKVVGHPLRWNASVSEGLSASLDVPSDGSPISLHDLARRGLREELAVHSEEALDLELLGFGLDLYLHQWVAFFRAVLPSLSEEDLRRRWSRGIVDRWEHDAYAFVPATPDDVLDFIRQQPETAWTSCAPALFYLALVRGAVLRRGGDPAGRLDVHAAERRVMERRSESADPG